MSISKINEYYMKKGLPTPEYKFYQSVDGKWSCTLGEYVAAGLSKQSAKLAVANKFWKDIENTTLTLSPKRHTIILLDGDQRVDCWRWLNTVNLLNTQVLVFINPTSHREPSTNMTLHVSRSTSPDSTDAQLLMKFGYMIYNDIQRDNDIIIVSRDHILVQAAIDYKCGYATDVESLNSYFHLDINVGLDVHTNDAFHV